MVDNVSRMARYFFRKKEFPMLNILKIKSAGNNKKYIFVNLLVDYKFKDKFNLTLVLLKKDAENFIKILKKEYNSKCTQ